LICSFFISCITTEAVKIGTAPERPPVPPEKVVVYRTADQVPGKYEEIALIISSGEVGWSSLNQMIESMKKKAGKLGANAIILDAMSEPSAEAKIVSIYLSDGWSAGYRHGKAVAIYVFPEKKEEI